MTSKDLDRIVASAQGATGQLLLPCALWTPLVALAREALVTRARVCKSCRSWGATCEHPEGLHWPRRDVDFCSHWEART
jgi:hypothetical protein